MRVLRRLALAAAMLVCLSVTFAAAAIATEAHMAAGSSSILGKGVGPGGLLPAGNYVNTNVFAGFNPCCSGGPQLNINVSDFTNVADPLGAPSTSVHEVDVSFSACDFNGGVCGGGCFIPDGATDFTFSSTAAVLKTTVTSTTSPCQGAPPTTLPTPFTVNVTWTAVGSSFSSSGTGHYECGAYTSETRTTNSGNTATNATATTSLLTGTFTGAGANLSTFDQRIHAQGTPLDACNQLGGKGAGFGPLAAGNYRFVSSSANLTIFPTDPSQASINVFVNRFSNTSSPTGGPTTTQAETDLNIFEFAFPQIISGCFIVPSSAFTIGSGLQSASLHASIDSTTTPCPHGNNSGLPAAFTVNVTWTGTGPVASFRSDSTSTCASLHTVSAVLGSSSTATATGDLSGIAGSFTTPQAGLGTNDSTTHVQGTQTCF